MAIKVNRQLDNGLVINDAYVRVDTVSGYKNEITISVNTYFSREDFLGSKPYLEHKLYNFTPNSTPSGKEMWSQCYGFLKTLEEYVGAEDIFENE